MDINQEKLLLSLRPLIPQATIDDITSKNETFQNLTLRPIIKLLNDSILMTTKATLYQFNKNFGNLPFDKKLDGLRTFLEKNQKIRYNLCGMVAGFMTSAELETYFQTSSEYNKIILQMVEQRVVYHIEYFN